ncbi:GM11036 [Drosophila sechellia]|uniref:GM11036 n=1 Tax=Drosophila sechellia TaxID=7238 RepID=B4IPG7_DROSE|nr:GM11036 [Drosophila sechellia]
MASIQLYGSIRPSFYPNLVVQSSLLQVPPDTSSGSGRVGIVPLRLCSSYKYFTR